MRRLSDRYPPPDELYLAEEVQSPIRREWVGGFAYGMAGASNRHNQIATNVLVELGSRLRGRRCRPFNSDTKLRVRLSYQQIFYYPDAMVVCQPNPAEHVFQDAPAVLVEVLSPATRRIDEGEKAMAYATIPSLMAYLMVDQDEARIVVLRRSGETFAAEVYEGLAAVVPLPEIEADLPLAAVYDGVGV